MRTNLRGFMWSFFNSAMESNFLHFTRNTWSAALSYRTFFLISFIYVEKISPFQLFLGVYYYITKMLINYNARWKNRVKVKKSSKSQHQKTFTLCTCVIFDHFCQCFISGTENGYNALSPTNVENLVVS